MDTMYQRGKNEEGSPFCSRVVEIGQQIANVLAWQTSRDPYAPVGETENAHVVGEDAAAASKLHDGHGLSCLQKTAQNQKNVFSALMQVVKTQSLGQTCHVT